MGVAHREHVFWKALALGAENERRGSREVDLFERSAVMRDQRDATPRRVAEREQRHAEDRAHRRPDRLRPSRIGAAVRQRNERRAQRVGSSDQRPDVARVADVPEGEPDGRLAARQVAPAEDADDPRRMAERRDVGQQRRLDVFARDEQLSGFDSDAARRSNEVFALGDEEAELVPPAAVLELADELELLVVARGDQALRAER